MIIIYIYVIVYIYTWLWYIHRYIWLRFPCTIPHPSHATWPRHHGWPLVPCQGAAPSSKSVVPSQMVATWKSRPCGWAKHESPDCSRPVLQPDSNSMFLWKGLPRSQLHSQKSIPTTIPQTVPNPSHRPSRARSGKAFCANCVASPQRLQEVPSRRGRCCNRRWEDHVTLASGNLT